MLRVLMPTALAAISSSRIAARRADARILQAQVDDDDEDGQRDPAGSSTSSDPQRESRTTADVAGKEAADGSPGRSGDALRPVGDVDRRIQVVHEDAHDFAETEGHDGQVIAAQLEGRRTEQTPAMQASAGAEGQDRPDRQVQAEMRAASKAQV